MPDRRSAEPLGTSAFSLIGASTTTSWFLPQAEQRARRGQLDGAECPGGGGRRLGRAAAAVPGEHHGTVDELRQADPQQQPVYPIAARHIAHRLRALNVDAPPHLDTLAEILYSVEGRTAEAIALETRALASGGNSYDGIYERNLARFRRGSTEPPEELAAFDVPELGQRKGRARR